MPRARATQICTTSLGELEEPLRRRPDVQVAIIQSSMTGVGSSHEGVERGSVSQEWEQVGTREKDVEGGETEAALAS